VPAFIGEQKRCSELCRDRTGTDDAVHFVSRGNTTRRDDGSVEARPQAGKKLRQRFDCRLRGRVEGAAVAARGRALRDERAATKRSAKASAVSRPPATKPRPAALVAAAASSGVVGPPAIGATMTGTA
jgi:hypothetical protein